MLGNAPLGLAGKTCHRVALMYERGEYLTGNKLVRLGDNLEFDKLYLSAVSLHSHTNHSKESLLFIPEFARNHPILHWPLERQAKRATIPVDRVKADWTLPSRPSGL